MDGRQGWKEKSGDGRRLERGVWKSYVITGAALAILRVSLFAWVEHRAVVHKMNETVYNLMWGLYPEALLAGYTPVGGWFHIDNLTPYFLFWGSMLTLGSFIMAIPILLVGWLRQRRR